jgi:hypothetical protein
MREAAISWLEPYHERWELLDERTTVVPFLTSAWFVEQARVFGLPTGHPGFNVPPVT